MGSNNQRIEFYCYIVRNNQYFSMSQKMKYTVFLFLLHFMQTNSQEYNITKNPQNTVWMINANGEVHEIKHNSILKSNRGYMFINIQESNCHISYLIGSGMQKVNIYLVIPKIVKAVNEAFRKIPEFDIIFTRQDSTNVTEKIPRLYDVVEAYVINQVEIVSKAINTKNSYVLYDGSVVTVYHSKPKDSHVNTDNIKRKIAESFAKYIVKFEKTENNNIMESFEEANKQSFIKKILEILKQNNNNEVNKLQKKKLNKAVKSLYTQEKVITEGITSFPFGSEECRMYTKYLVIDSLKSTCIYYIRDNENNEIFLYLGKKSKYEEQEEAIQAANKDYEELHSKMTFIVEGNPLPPAFMIHIESEVKNLLKVSSKA